MPAVMAGNYTGCQNGSRWSYGGTPPCKACKETPEIAGILYVSVLWKCLKFLYYIYMEDKMQKSSLLTIDPIHSMLIKTRYV